MPDTAQPSTAPNPRRGAGRTAIEFYASCPEGFEDALDRELRGMGLRQVRKLKGRVSFAGEVADAYRACMWSRLASRVFAVIARFDCANADELYAGSCSVPWEDILRSGASIAVTARGGNDELRNSHFSALRVKDAICDRLSKVAGARPIVDTEEPDARIALSIRGERASLHLDLSGDPLFKRLPRMATRPGAAHVLRPDYAALVLAESGWQEACGKQLDGDGGPLVLVDASCAGGGLELEATGMLLDRAPGLLREHWGFEGWALHDADAWQKLVEEADARSEAGAARAAAAGAAIVATDVSGGALEFARRIVKKAGFARYVAFASADAAAVHDTVEDALAGFAPHPHANAYDGAGLETASEDGSGARLGSAKTNSETEFDSGADAATAAAATGTGTTTDAGLSSPIVVADTTEITFNRMPAFLSLVAGLRGAAAFRQAPVTALTRDDMLDRALATKPARVLHVKPGNEDARILVFDPAATSSLQAAEGPVKAGGSVESDGQAQDQAAKTAPFPASTSLIDLGDGKPVAVLIPESEQFARRLRKVARLRRKWAQREGITCYRVYDADLPDYSAAIDLYQGSASTPGRWLVVAEYAAPKSVDPALAQARLLDILAIAPRVLDVDPDDVYAKARIRSRGGSQYGKRRAGATGSDPAAGAKPESFLTRRLPLIEEGGLTFAVNFDDYLDTGIFLDHRITRGLVRERARGKRFFCNLFAYTGTASCYAADAGVEETVTVDLSNTYLDWAERNMRQNGFTGREHHYVRADVMGWIADMRRTTNRWDLIFCDPPTFSNSSKMGRRTWDAQRDHAELIIGMSRLLTLDGEAIFSCNLRTFRPDTEKLARAGVVLTDITARTIPEDFARNPRIHHCYLVKRYTVDEALRLTGLA